jgi:hypothetical protein
MTAIDITLILCVVLSGLWSGLLLAVTNLLHPMFKPLDGPSFAQEMRRFLPAARRAPVNWVCVLGLLFVPVAALVALESGSTAFVLVALGLACCIAGPFLVSNRLAEPNYARMLAWDPAAMPADWKETRQYYFTLNWVRGVATWAAFGLFAAAAYSAWS